MRYPRIWLVAVRAAEFATTIQLIIAMSANESGALDTKRSIEDYSSGGDGIKNKQQTKNSLENGNHSKKHTSQKLKPSMSEKKASKKDLPQKMAQTTTEKHENQNEPTTSLSLEQVNNDADELVELRGEGRYFGVTDPSSGDTINALQSLGPLCANCHKRGHIRAKCKTVVCHKCGVVGDHYETQCPTTMVCSRCGHKGHMAAGCTNKAKKRQYCKACDTFNHGDDRCPTIWRSYLTNTTDAPAATTLPVVYCYNCGLDVHYGDECPQPRTLRVPNIIGTAFSGSNLPRDLRSKYFDRIRGARPRSTHAPAHFAPYKPPSRKDFSKGLSKSTHNPSRSGVVLPRKEKSKGKNFSNGKQQPTRSGFIESKKKITKPTRSGRIDKRK